MAIRTYAETGRRHKMLFRECEDTIAAYEDEQVGIVVVSDGCSSSPAAKEASSITAHVLTDFLRVPEAWNIPNIKSIKQTVLKALHQAYRASTVDEQYLCATVAAVAVRANGDYLAISIGDCTMYAYNVALQPFVFIKPYNGKSENHTVFGNMQEEAMRTMTVRKGNRYHDAICGFTVVSDGASCLTQQPEELRTAAALTILHSSDSFLSGLAKSIASTDTTDDTSIAVLIPEDAQIYALAERIVPQYQWNLPRQTHRFCGNTDYEQIMQALLRQPLSMNALVMAGFCEAGHVLETVLPLIERKLVCYEKGMFRIAKGVI